MVTFRNKKQLGAIISFNHEKNPRNSAIRDTKVRIIQKEYITQVPNEIEDRVTKKMSQEVNKTESRIWVPCPSYISFL